MKTYRTALSGRLALSVASVLGLSACSGGPSDSDIQKALQAANRVEITSVAQSNCTAADEGRYRCTFRVKTPGFDERDSSSLFEKGPGGWNVVGE